LGNGGDSNAWLDIKRELKAASLWSVNCCDGRHLQGAEGRFVGSTAYPFGR